MIAEVLQNLKVRGQLSKVTKLAKCILVMPAANATSKRSFRLLKLTKTYLQLIMR